MKIKRMSLGFVPEDDEEEGSLVRARVNRSNIQARSLDAGKIERSAEAFQMISI